MNRPVYCYALLACGLAAGCDQAAPPTRSTSARQSPVAARTTADPGPPSNQEYELTTGTVYFEGDPQHGHAAQGTFRRGTKVNVLKRSGPFVLVRSAEGEQGYVVENSLEPAAVQ